MLRPKILPSIFVVLPATILLTAQSGFAGSTSGECRTGPGAPARMGLHWYYRVDRANNRHCWYLYADGMQVRARGDAVSPNPKPQREDVARQTREATSQSSTIQIAPPQLETAPTARDETPFLAPSLPENTAIDFGSRWRDLPKSVDLGMREVATGSNRYGAEPVVTEAEEQMPSTPYSVPGADNGVRQTSAGEADLWSILVAGVLAMALLILVRDVLKLARILHRRAQRRRVHAGFDIGGSGSTSGVWHRADGWSALAPTDPAYCPETSRDELMRALRRVDAELDSPRSFAPSGVQITKSPTDQGISKHSEWSNPAVHLVGEKTREAARPF